MLIRLKESSDGCRDKSSVPNRNAAKVKSKMKNHISFFNLEIIKIPAAILIKKRSGSSVSSKNSSGKNKDPKSVES
jgi:hypothetical protein